MADDYRGTTLRVLYLVLVYSLAFVLHVFGETFLAGVVGFGGVLLGLLVQLVVIVRRQ